MTEKARFTKDRVASTSHTYSYYVTGSGEFPWDMLRYDHAWPATSEDAVKLAPFGDAKRERRSIRIRSLSEPTIGRWASFMWSVGLEKLD